MAKRVGSLRPIATASDFRGAASSPPAASVLSLTVLDNGRVVGAALAAARLTVFPNVGAGLAPARP